jgi:cytochrome c-type biogenesis protein
MNTRRTIPEEFRTADRREAGDPDDADRAGNAQHAFRDSCALTPDRGTGCSLLVVDSAALTAWLDQTSGMSALVVAAVALAGLLVGVAPSSLPLYSVVAGYVGGQAGGRARGLLLSTSFILGLATVDAGIGILFGFLGLAVIVTIARWLAVTNLAIAAILIVLGLALLRQIHIVLPVLRPQARRVETLAAAYALGVPFGLTTCPACTPMVLPVLGAAAATGSPWTGGLLLFVFGIARGVPLVFVGAAAQAASRMPRLAPLVPAIERAGGVVLLFAALFFLYQSAVFAGLAPPIPFLV